MDPSQVAIATITRAQSRDEEDVLRRSLRLLANAEWPVAVADTDASAAFAEFLRGLRGFRVIVPPEQGLVAQVQASLALASRFERPFLLYVEPDKELFFEQGLNEFLRRAPEGPDIGIVLASRSPASFDTFPPMQRYTEGVINQLCAQLLGPVGDYSYGPFLLNAALVPRVATLERRVGWGWRHFTFVAARRAGLPVVHVTGEYPCPPEQRHEDDSERRHRMRQLSENIRGLIQ
jgi:hypothetical protein